MSKHTKWDIWISENVRYAMTKVPFVKASYSEYFFSRSEGNRIVEQGIVDIVGKHKPSDELKDSVIVEIKGTNADINSGKGQNFIGKYNFFATDEAFIDQLIRYRNNRYKDTGIGVLLVRKDGSVSTVIPSVNKGKELSIESDFSEFETDDEVENYFRDVVIPQQKYWDSHKPYYRNICA